LAEPSLTTHGRSFDISYMEVNGPLNLDATVLSAQTSEPEWLRNGPSFTDVEELAGVPVEYTVNQAGSVDRFLINVRLVSAVSAKSLLQEVKSHLSKVLGLRDNIESFYRRYSDEGEPLSGTFPKLRGLRLMRGTNLYESLICSILSQNNSARLWNRKARLVMQHYGRRVDFPGGSMAFRFPDPHTLAKISPKQLQAITSMGYRARPVVEVSGLIVRGELQLDEIVQCPYEEAMEILLELPGIGPKVADCFLLYGAGKLEAAPVDVWIRRIVSELYFRGRRISPLKAGRFLRDRFGEWAGYAQLYLFDYARRRAAEPTRKIKPSRV